MAGSRRPPNVRLLAARNLAKSLLALGATCAALAALGWVAGDLRFLSIFLFCGLLAGLTVATAGDRIILGMIGARELALGEAPALFATVSALSTRAGIRPPRLYVVADGVPHALAVGRGSGSAAIAVSRGLLGACSPAELEAVLAHEIAHIRTRDVQSQTIAVVVAAVLYDGARLGGFLERPLRFVLAPLASAAVHALLSPARELAADQLAALWCESPHPLADALLRLEQAADLVRFEAPVVTSPLWTIDPFPEAGPAALFATHPPVGDRVTALRSLDPGWQSRLRQL